MTATIAAGPFILAAIDGTQSEDYMTGGNVSSVLKFHNNFKVSGGSSVKKYWQGPDILGVDVRTPLSPVTYAVCTIPKLKEAACRGVHGLAASATRWIVSEHAKLTDPQVVLVGHSRGGLICIDVAKRLMSRGIDVFFMGLYDAVDMAAGMDGSTIPSTVQNVYHAMRDPGLGSRRLWGNAGKQVSSSTDHNSQHFWGTHGSIGGAPDAACKKGDLVETPIVGYAVPGDECKTDLTASRNRNARILANNYVVAGARSVGLPV